MAAYMQIEVHQRGFLKPREMVLVLAKQNGHLYLDYEKRGMNIFLRFFEDELGLGESAELKAWEILESKGLVFKELELLASVFPQHGNYDRVFIFLASQVKSVKPGSMVSLSLTETVEAMRAGLFLGSRCEKALALYLRHLKKELSE